jgi:FKBP-type peptidyl-prolyl cis-trans isomerase 2
MTFEKKDFIEVEFTGKIKNGDIFDSNIKEDLARLNPKEVAKPFIFCLGEGMFLKGIDDFLLGKEVGEYNVELSPDKAFGPRIPEMIQRVPSKLFRDQRLNPVIGAVFNFDGRIGKILSVSGGRVMIDFNNPLSGKEVVYKIKVLRKVEDQKEKIRSFLNFLFRRDLTFSIEEKKVVVEVEKNMAQFVRMFQEKFKEVFGLDLEVKEIASKPQKEGQ